MPGGSSSAEKRIEIDGEWYDHLGTLKDDAFAQTELVEQDGRRYLYKVSRLRLIRGLKLRWLMKRLNDREIRTHHLLAGVHGVPRLVKRVSETSFLREYVDGRTLDRKPPYMRPDFFDEFLEIVRSIHGRGVAFVDLAKKENVVVTREGRPFLIDFQVSIARSTRRGPIAAIWNAAVRIMQEADVYHVYKHKKRIRPDLLRPEERRYARRPWFQRIHKYCFRLPYHAVKRRIIPKHGDSRYPFYENEG